jgi:hypothetical protein
VVVFMCVQRNRRKRACIIYFYICFDACTWFSPLVRTAQGMRFWITLRGLQQFAVGLRTVR